MNRALVLCLAPVLAGATLLPACHGGRKAPKPAASAKPPPATLKPPPTPKHNVVDHYFSAAVTDPYRWLEDGKAPAVQKWIAAQNAYADKVMGSFPERTAIEKRVRELSLTSTDRFDPALAAGQLFFLQQTPPQQQAVLAQQPWPKGAVKVLYDPNQSKGTAITRYWPSADGKYVAYGTAEGGSEATTIHIVRVADGKQLPDSLPYAGGGTTPQALAWDPDSKGLVYVRLPLPGTVKPDELQFNAAIYHHVLGKPAKDDTLAFGEGLSPVAEYSFAVSGDGKHRAILVHFGDGNPDRVYVEKKADWKLVLGPLGNVRAGGEPRLNGGAASWLGDNLLVITHQGAPRGKLIMFDSRGGRRDLVDQQKWAMHEVFAVKGGFVLVMVQGPTWRVDQYDEKGKLVRNVPLPDSGISVNEVASSDLSDQMLLEYSGWKIAGRWVQYDTAAGKLHTVFSVKPPADYSKVHTQLVTAVSKDGTHVPVTVLSLEGVKADGKRPTILSAYGGYGVMVGPRFLGPYLTWLEHGGVYAVANIRGGGEFGEGWHEDGMLEHKQNDFDDFYAAARWLEKSGWTDKQHLGILGGSNGGLLMGAALTQHPSAFRAVASFVGIYDMLRAELWPNGRYNISEYGTVQEEKQFDWLYAYSPLHHVKPGVAYPAILLETGVNDPRVAPWQSRKFAAALQAATISDRPIVLITRMNAGHGVTASFSQRVGNKAAALTFFAHELGLDIKP